ncbi:hypothetical protein BP5796_10768 [Coleophoma crateriformis]|uniref:Ketoreductase domain-containing protein n=1 Tax=Coleophoma crateriformis TaxID=565419 RepID=A0A3D8QR19_9HELO|nr:hypothetical protein BP5796_10768 [Coleophoma crateriformis]
MASAASQALFSLQGQTALVTGGTRGIGQSVAIALAEAGADIILIQRDTSNTATQKSIQELGRKATIYTADLASQQDVAGLIAKVLADGHTIQILINCAGIQRRHPSHKFPDSDWNEVIQVNLNTVFTICRDVGAHMLSQPAPRSCRIINFASLLTFQGGLTVPAYAASKGAVAQLTKALANEWSKEGITVNAIAPGYIETDMNTALLADKDRLRSISERIPAGRWGKPDDFKAPTIFLAGPGGAYVSGHVLVVDGGWMGR